MSTGLKANVDGSAAIQVGGTDVITLTSGGAATFVTSPTTVQAGTAAAPSITFSGDTNTGIYSPGADTIAFTEGGVESMRIDSSGNLGLGVTPSAWSNITALQVESGSLSAGSIDTYLSSNAFYSTASPSGWKYITSTNATQFYQNASGGEFVWRTAASGTAGNAISFTQAMTLDASGNLMVGTTTAADALTVSSIDTDTRIYIQASDTGTGNSNGYMLGTISSVAYVWNYENQPLLFGTNGAQRGRFTEGGYFKASSTATYSAGTTGAVHEFDTSSVDGTIVNFYNQAASNPNGIYVGYTAADPNDATRYVFGAQQNTGVWIYRIYSNGTVAARSDVKWKKNIETARDGYAEDLAKLRVVKYNWYNHDDGTPKELGLIAQEVEQVFPGLVTTDEQTRNEIKTREIPAVLDEEGNEVEPSKTEEYTEKVGTGEYSKSIKFSVLPIMLLKAIQEQQAMIDELKAKVAALEGA